MKTVIYFEICTGLDPLDPDATEELGFETSVECFYEKPDHSVGIGESYEVVYGKTWTLERASGPDWATGEPKSFTEAEMEVLVGLGVESSRKGSWDAVLRDHEDSVAEDYRELYKGEADYEDEREWDDPMMGGRDPLER